MTSEELLKQYNDWKFRLSVYEMALSIIEIDKLTVAPVAGASYRDERTAFLAGEHFSIMTDEASLNVVKELKESAEDPDIRKEAETYYREIMKIVSIPKEDYVAFQRARDASYDAWVAAREADDYSIYEPHLKSMIEWSRKLYRYRDCNLPLYDQMLDDFEPGMNTAAYDRFFESIKEKLLPFIQKVIEAKPIDESFLYESCDTAKQKAWTEQVLLPYLRFDKDWGFQNETEHPFTSWTCENDCRTTTRYFENNVTSSVFSTIHETGHAWYEHNISPKYDGTILSTGVSSGMHESQSRFCENYLGRSLPFWQANYRSLQETFPDVFENISLEQFYRAINASKRSLIRTEADELTYPIHILIRYEIEKGLFSGSISTEHLDETWNEIYQKYLGVHADRASDGILQDVHWSDASFGYFPTYALGSAFAAQFFHAMKQQMDVDAALRENRYIDCIYWLKDHIHQYGARYSADEIMVMATGESFNPNYYLDYLIEKYSRLYSISL